MSTWRNTDKLFRSYHWTFERNESGDFDIPSLAYEPARYYGKESNRMFSADDSGFIDGAEIFEGEMKPVYFVCTGEVDDRLVYETFDNLTDGLAYAASTDGLGYWNCHVVMAVPLPDQEGKIGAIQLSIFWGPTQ